MTRAPSTFRQADVTRALKGALKAGYLVNKAVINRGGDIVLTFGTTEHECVEPNPWDKVLIDASNEKRPS
jgi:hypothetical protein